MLKALFDSLTNTRLRFFPNMATHKWYTLLPSTIKQNQKLLVTGHREYHQRSCYPLIPRSISFIQKSHYITFVNLCFNFMQTITKNNEQSMIDLKAEKQIGCIVVTKDQLGVKLGSKIRSGSWEKEKIPQKSPQ